MKVGRGVLRSLAALSLATCLSAGLGAKAQDSPIFRHSADFFRFDGTEFFTATTAVAGSGTTTPGTPDGALFYRKKVRVAPSSNILYVSLYATGDAHGGAALWLSCRVNLSFCRPSTVPAVDGAPSGWITLLKLPLTGLTATSTPSTNCNNGGGGSADCHDNAVTYQWCVPVRGGSTVQVDLKMATSASGNNVFLEKGHVFVDSSRIVQPDQCVQAPSPVGVAPRPTGVQEEVAGVATPEQHR